VLVADYQGMTGLEVAVGFLVAWFARKAGRVGKRVDGMADEVLDAGLEKLHEVVVAKLGGDSALAKLESEVTETGEAGTRTEARVRLSLEEAAEEDPRFASALESAVVAVRGSSAAAGDHGVAIAGGVTATDGGIAIGGVTGGSVRLGPPIPDRG
jgi:hypothetical protein